ncbi:DUF4136 domain-containing protein [Alkalimarinus alittae]|uniref:DUF4136 domain-containing protein n=1 Tax=Alkalimarinus alittae TaxID=2961619 RepID=A0ABY6N365_9ALTE|nr:DUF4136 domain-containing protein [Alkalimarinus alittae]UZE96490.1 DUF4136 domain-containing protein [Alkalimarinus alittae]
MKIALIQINFILLCSIALFISGCGNKLQIETEYSKATHFDEFKYYRWHQGNTPQDKKQAQATGNKAAKKEKEIDPLLDSNIRFMIEQQLAKKGLVKREEGVVDFLVNYSISTHNQVDVETQKVYDGYSTTYQSVGGYGYGYAGGYYRGVAVTMDVQPVNETLVERYVQGSMTLDFIEPDDNKLIWRATGDKRLPYDHPDQQERDALINKVIGKLLAKFPPK